MDASVPPHMELGVSIAASLSRAGWGRKNEIWLSLNAPAALLPLQQGAIEQGRCQQLASLLSQTLRQHLSK